MLLLHELQMAAGDQILVSTSSMTGSWSVAIDLQTGEVLAPADPEGGHKVSATLLSKLREEARSAHAGGDRHVREQHADGRVEFAISLAGETVRIVHETWGDGDYAGVRTIWQTATRMRAKLGR